MRICLLAAAGGVALAVAVAVSAVAVSAVAVSAVAVSAGAGEAVVPPGGATPLPRAHAHNDYEHDRPLLDALDHGFCSVEADIHLVDGALLVAHDREDCVPGRTLERLYLDPLQARVRQHDGRVYRDGPAFTLLVDIKSEGAPAYAVLADVLAPYAGMLTRYEQGDVVPGAVTVILSGNRPTEVVRGQASRLVFIDGRMPDLEANPPASLVPLVSDHWGRTFGLFAGARLNARQTEKLRAIVAEAHAQGRRVRFWATPERPELWRTLADAGVDLINTDDLAGLRDFLRDYEDE